MIALRGWFRRLRGRQALTDALWRHAVDATAYARIVDAASQQRLRALVDRFLDTKSIEGAHGLTITDEMRALVAVRACMPILNLDLSYYAPWYAVVLYPADFRVHDEYTDDTGVVHHGTRELCGESLTQGPVVLSWPAVLEDNGSDGLDLVIHECAHKLDMLNGDASGFPPLHADMSVPEWTQTMSGAYERFCQLVDDEVATRLDPYAATDPAEFFACLSETFFAAPWVIAEDFPATYALLCRFYRQDPHALRYHG